MSTVISLRNAKIYQQEKLILDNLDLELEEKTFAYLIGKTGSGKSSLLKTLYAELPLTEGIGIVCGFELKALNASKFRSCAEKLALCFRIFSCSPIAMS